MPKKKYFKTRKRRSSKQHVYTMHGCSHNKTGGSGCGSCGCPIAPLSSKQMAHFGGTCGATCGLSPPASLNGGSSSFVGSPWTPNPSSWGTSNYLDGIGNTIIKDPQLQMTTNSAGYTNSNSKIGGKSCKRRRPIKKSRKHKKKLRGGGLVPQDLVNLGSNFSYNLKSAYNSLNGYKAPIDPMPYKDQLIQTNKLVL